MVGREKKIKYTAGTKPPKLFIDCLSNSDFFLFVSNILTFSFFMVRHVRCVVITRETFSAYSEI